jgi:ketosteroid isomerase-like protein
MTDLATLQALNRDYIASVQAGDVKRFGEILSEDFLNSNPDSSIIDKAAFLKQIAPPVKIRNLACHDVNIRIMGDFAIIHARTAYELLDGRPGHGRYTDIYAKRNGQWLCVAAHVGRN